MKKKIVSKTWQLWANCVSTSICPRSRLPKRLRAIDPNDTLLWTFKARRLEEAKKKAFAYLDRKNIDITKLKRPTWLKSKNLR